MTNMIKGCILTAMLAMGANLYAVRALNGVISVPTADGSTLSVRLVGDEFSHQYMTEDGFPLQEKNGNFYYCDIDAFGKVIESGIKATQISHRTDEALKFLAAVDKGGIEKRIQARISNLYAGNFSRQEAKASNAPAKAASMNDAPPFEKGYGLTPNVRFPAYGKQKAIVILVEFQDRRFNSSYNAGDYFRRMLNEDGFSSYGGTGSVAQYFRENSGGAFDPQFDVYGPILLPNVVSYYGANDPMTGADKNAGGMVKDACDILDPIVNFKDYDRNNDGIVDNIFVFYAGESEAAGGGPNTIWPHSFNLSSAGYPNTYYDGVRVHTYGCANEWQTYTGTGRPDGIGTFVHEFSHVMGLPDLYTTDGSSAFTPKAWSVLDFGSYNNSGVTPCNYGAYERYALGWIKPREITKAASATLEPIEEMAAGIIRTPNEKEFYLIENRQNQGWDTFLPGHGMLVWHIDYDPVYWSANKVNCAGDHLRVDLVEADDSRSDYTLPGDPFPGSSNKTSFTPDTNPAMVTWSGQALNYPITNIKETNGIITFNILGGASSQVNAIQANNATEVTPVSFKVSWQAPSAGNEVLLSVYKRIPGSDTPIYVGGYHNRSMGSATSATINDLDAETTYYYTVSQLGNWNVSAPSAEKSVTTTEYTIDYLTVETSPASDVQESCFTANWKSLPKASEYYLTVKEKKAVELTYDYNGFDGGTNNLGDWTVSPEVTTYSLGNYCGQAVPALRFADKGTLTTPVYDDFVHEVSFWHRGNNTAADDVIEIYAIGKYQESLVASVPIDKSGMVVTVRDIPEETLQIKFSYRRSGSNGYVAVDDVSVGHGTAYEIVSLAGYENLNVGNVLSYTVENLKPNTEYLYSVKATDGSLFSRDSEVVAVKTENSNAIESVETTPSDIRIIGGVAECGSNDEIVIVDITGAVVARGFNRVAIPAGGLYIVTVPTRQFVKKIIMK